jgi:hypothetical protein
VLSVPTAEAALSLEQHLSAGTIWANASASVDNSTSSCPAYFRLQDSSQYMETAENEDYRPGDMSLTVAGFDYDEEGDIDETLFGNPNFLYRPNAPMGKRTLDDNTSFILGVVNNKSTIENREDRVILDFSATAASIIMAGRTQRRLVYHKQTGSIELTIRDSGTEEEHCTYQITDVARQPAAVVNGDRTGKDVEEASRPRPGLPDRAGRR